LVTEPDTGELIRKDIGEVVSSDNALSEEKKNGAHLSLKGTLAGREQKL
jgi:hypothetical protein